MDIDPLTRAARGGDGGQEIPVAAADVEVRPRQLVAGQLLPGVGVAPGRMVPERVVANGGPHPVERAAHAYRISSGVQRLRSEDGPGARVLGNDGSERFHVPDRADPASGFFCPQEGDLMVVGHLAAGTLARDGDGHLAHALDQPHGVAGMGDDDIRALQPAGQLLRCDVRPLLAGQRQHRRAGLGEHVVLGAQRRHRRQQPIERPPPHPDGHDDVEPLHQ